MPYRAEDFLESPLDALERELVRDVLGINGKPDSAIYIDSEARMDELTPAQCQLIRVLLEDADEIGIDTTKVVGGSRGANIDFERDESKAAKKIRRILYPTIDNDPENPQTTTQAGSIQFITAEYITGSQTEFE